MKIIVSGQSNKPLARSIALKNKLPLAKVEIKYFPNGEKSVRIITPVKNKEVIIVQSLSSPPDENIVELALLTDACKRAGAKSITALIPWLGYSPQDKVFRKGEALSAEVIIKMLDYIGIDKFLLYDLHSTTILPKFKSLVEHKTAMPLFVNYFKKEIKNKNDWIAVAVDKGSYERANEFATALGLSLARFDKKRNKNTGEVKFIKFDGDVKGKKVITFDDYVSTGSTLIKSAEYMKSIGALEYHFCVTHIVVKDAIRKIINSKIDKLISTNSVNLPELLKYKKAKVLDLADLITL